MRLGVVGLVAVGCGRIGFDTAGTSIDAAGGDDTLGLVDGPPGSVTRVFGECTEADVTNVTADNYLDQSTPMRNHGRTDRMRVGAVDVSLVRFTLTAIPTSATLLSAELLISVSATDALEAGHVEVFRVLEAWEEGTQDFATGTSNYTERAAGLPWSTAGAGVPGSRSGDRLGMFAPALEDVRHAIALDVAGIRTWSSDPSTNHGVVLVGIETAGQGAWLSTTDDPDPARRPCLRVIYFP